MPSDLLAQRVAGLKRVLLPTQDVDSVDLAQKRHQNDLHLKGTLESIYQKYSRDFTDVGDEINILTGEVILDRGHVEGMKSELDDGTGQTSTSHMSWLNTLVVDDSEAEELDSDEDELCIRSVMPAKFPNGRDLSRGAIPSTEVGRLDCKSRYDTLTCLSKMELANEPRPLMSLYKRHQIVCFHPTILLLKYQQR